ncbi:MAG: hypothetical protein CMC13_06985 [Flavobacteriaceae bacterium]|nr:hypothetical protein [Flavobacteriaceae bacterium]
MELIVNRSYYSEGTNSTLTINGNFICFIIELPWKENQRNVSCIPEGTYSIKPRWSRRFGHHLMLCDVPNRTFILIHPANNAKQELEGCLAPVSHLTGIGRGAYSKIVAEKITALCQRATERGEQLRIIIKSNKHECNRSI